MPNVKPSSGCHEFAKLIVNASVCVCVCVCVCVGDETIMEGECVCVCERERERLSCLSNILKKATPHLATHTSRVR